MKTDCIFCKIVSGEVGAHKVYETGDFLAFLDINPISKGHTIVIPKRHFSSLDEFPPELSDGLIRSLKKVSKALLISLQTSGFNIILNNGHIAGQVIPHIHFHIIPRFSNDGLLKHPPSKKMSHEELAKISQQLMREIQSFEKS